MKGLNVTNIPGNYFYSYSFTLTIIFILLMIIVTTVFFLSHNKSPDIVVDDKKQKLEVVCYNPTADTLKLFSNFLPDTNELEPSEDLVPLNGLRNMHLLNPFSTNSFENVKLSTRQMVAFEDASCAQQINLSSRHKNDGTDQEALKAVHLALELKRSSRFEKAKRLMQHAMALSPLHPEVLNHYAEFLEEDDIFEADRLYTRALMVCPGHSLAIANRMRTAPLVEAMDQEDLEKVDQKRKKLLRLDIDTPLLKRLKKEVYFLHIHHTLGIEGNTMSLAETRTVAETGMSIHGKSIREHNEVLGLQSALRYVKILVDSSGPKTVSDVIQIHKRVLGHVDPLSAGSFRRDQVFVGIHVPPPATQVEPLMEDFLQWLQSEEVKTLHPVKLAALAHHRIAYIHPFVDGNGRTARLIMNAILMGAGYPPVIIRKQDRSVYYETLQMANEGDVRPFVRFLARCTECTLDVFLNAGTYHDSGNCLRALEKRIEVSREEVISL